MHFEFFKNIIVIYNYRQIMELKSDLIRLENISVLGSDLMVIRLDKDDITIKGDIKRIILGE